MSEANVELVRELYDIEWVWTVRDEKLVRMELFRTPEGALQAAGLTPER
jgi:hypothetical protein